MCHYTQSLEGLGSGDVAVFSVGFNVSVVKDLRRKGVLIAFESGVRDCYSTSKCS